MVFAERYRSVHESRAALLRCLAPYETRAPASAGDLERVLASAAPGSERVMYVHTPYCDRVCSFCDFVTARAGRGWERYGGELENELAALGRRPYLRARPSSAVYFGGGTPTLYDTGQLARLLRVLRRHVPLAEDCEITFESTLHNLDRAKLRLLVAAGVNRLSLGVQTFSARGRRLLTRTGGPAEARRRVAEARRFFPGVLGLDLIYAYPGQTEAELLEDARTAAALGPDSISFYSLRFHPGSTLGRLAARGRLDFRPDLERERALQNLFLAAMREAGFAVLDLLKVGRGGRDVNRYYRLKYQAADLVPVGVGAGGEMGGIGLYRLAPGVVIYSRVTPLERRYRRLLALLQHPRVSLAAVERLGGAPAATVLAARLPALEAERLAVRHGEADYELTDDGIFWGNNVAAWLLEGVVAAALGPITARSPQLTPATAGAAL